MTGSRTRNRQTKRDDAMGDVSKDRDIKYNASGYYDETAYRAILRAEKESSMGNALDYHDGDIIELVKQSGATEQALLIKCHSGYATTMMLKDVEPFENTAVLTTNDGEKLFYDAGRPGYVFFDNILGVSGTVSDEEMEKVRSRIARALGISVADDGQKATVPADALAPRIDQIKNMVNEIVSNGCDRDHIIRLEAERDIWKGLYEQERRKGE